MKEGLFIKAQWRFFRKTMIESYPILGVKDPEAFHRSVMKVYHREMDKLSDYGPNDVLQLNLAHAVMMSAVYECCDPKPDIDSLTRFYHDFMFRSALLRKALSGIDMLKTSHVQRQISIAERSQKATHPYTWQFSIKIHDNDRYTATFTRCGIYDYLKSRGMGHITPAMCAFDYAAGEASNHLFLRKETLSTGGKVCDCCYVRKSAATAEETAQCQQDKIAEAHRGGRKVIL